jgi:hypothetical protein
MPIVAYESVKTFAATHPWKPYDEYHMNWQVPDLGSDPNLDESYMAAMTGFNFLELGDDDGKVFREAQRAGSDATTAESSSFVRTSPREKASKQRVDQKEDARTTLMIRNIPRKYTQRQLLTDLIAVHDFSREVNFFYLPTDLGTCRNLGYCFLNFMCPHRAAAAKTALHKLRLSANAKSGLSLGYADYQGLEENLRNVRRSLMHRIKNREYRPLVADEAGVLVPISE